MRRHPCFDALELPANLQHQRARLESGDHHPEAGSRPQVPDVRGDSDLVGKDVSQERSRPAGRIVLSVGNVQAVVS